MSDGWRLAIFFAVLPAIAILAAGIGWRWGTVRGSRGREAHGYLDWAAGVVEWVVAPIPRVIQANPAFFRKTGLDPESIRGNEGCAWIGKLAGAEVARQVDEALRLRRPLRVEWCQGRGGGPPRWLELALAPGRGGRSPSVLGILRDISQQKREEEELVRRRQQLLTIIRHAPVILTTIDSSGKIELNEGRGLESLGLDRDQRVGQSIFEMYPDASPMNVGICRALAGEPSGMTLNLGGRVFESQFLPEFGAGGEVRGVHGIAIDITDRFRAERKYRDHQELLRLVLDAAEVGICLLDEELRFVMVNPRYCRIHGRSSGDLVGRRIDGLASPDDRDALVDLLRRVLAGEDIGESMRFRGLASSGEYLQLRIAAGRLVRMDKRTYVVCSVLDQTGHHRDAAELAVWEERYEAAAQASGQVLYDWDARTNHLHFRGATDAILGYSVEELDGPMGDFFDLMAPGAGSPSRTEMSLRIAAKGPYSREYPFSRKDGSIAILQDRGRFILDSDGRVVRMVGFLADITMIKGAEERLKRQKEILQTILDNMPGLLIYTGANGRILLANPEWERLAEASVVGRPLRQAISPLLADPEEAGAFAEFYEAPSQSPKVFRLRGPQGGLFEVSWAVARLSGGSRIAIGTDVTEFNRAQRELLRSHALLETIQLVQSQFIGAQGSTRIFETLLGNLLSLTESTVGFIGEVDGGPEGEPVFCLHALRSADGHGARDLDPEGKAADALLSRIDLLLEAAGRAEEFVLTNRPEVDLAPGWGQPGDGTIDSFLGLPLRRGQRMVGMVGLANRVGGYSAPLVADLLPLWSTAAAIIEAHQLEVQQQRLEADLRKSKEAADSANQAKSLFLANMSHEIRTPLTAILGYADMLRSPEALRSQVDRDGTLRAIQSNGEHLLQVINDILDLSKIEADKLELERAPESPWQLVREVVAAFAPRVEARGLWLRTQAPDGCPRWITTDGPRLSQILVNLVSNAVKFTLAGGIDLEVTTEVEAGGGTGGWLRISVSDTGPGIGPEHLARLFRPFQQGDTSMARAYGGTGLGLSISKRLAVALGGDLSAESAPGLGSTFTVRLPLSAEEAADRISSEEADAVPIGRMLDREAVPRLRGRILLVEDGGDNRVVIGHYLREAGVEAVVAENGQLALDFIRAGRSFDAVLMDIQMPVMNGYDATRGLRLLGYTGPIVALTANALESDRRKCLEAGCNNYVSKPIDRAALLRMLAAYLPGAEEEIPPPPDAFEGGSQTLMAGIDEEEGPLHSLFCHEEDFRVLIDEYAGRLVVQVAEMRRAASERDYARVAEVAHKIAGAGGMYGFPELSVAARSLESAAGAGATFDAAGADAALQALQKLVDRVQLGLDSSPPQAEAPPDFSASSSSFAR